MIAADELVGLLMLIFIIILGVMLYGCHAKAVSLKAKSNNQRVRHRVLYEGLSTAPATSGAIPGALPKSVCGPRQVARTYLNPQGAQVTVCTDASGGPDMSSCTSPWDMTATAEAQALAEVGGFQHDTYGERALQAAINSTYDSNVRYTNTEPQPSVQPGGDTDDSNPFN